jgi:hypothetical protein
MRKRGDYLRNRTGTISCLPRQIRDCREIQQLQTGKVSTINKFSAVTGVTVRSDGGQQVFSTVSCDGDGFHIKVVLQNSAIPPNRPNSLIDLRNPYLGRASTIRFNFLLLRSLTGLQRCDCSQPPTMMLSDAAHLLAQVQHATFQGKWDAHDSRWHGNCL